MPKHSVPQGLHRFQRGSSQNCTLSQCSIYPLPSTGPLGLLALLLRVRSPSPKTASEPGSWSGCPWHMSVHPRSLAASISRAKHPSTRFPGQGRGLHSLGLSHGKTPTGDFNQQTVSQAQSGQRGETIPPKLVVISCTCSPSAWEEKVLRFIFPTNSFCVQQYVFGFAYFPHKLLLVMHLCHFFTYVLVVPAGFIPAVFGTVRCTQGQDMVREQTGNELALFLLWFFPLPPLFSHLPQRKK